jgi:uncharacterized membrane protein YdbT with pleckstrin-like domain
MNIRDNQLLTDELIIYKGSVAGFVYFLPITLLIFAVISFYFFAQNKGLLLIPYIFAIMSVIFFLRAFMRRIKEEFIISTKRIIIKKGIFFVQNYDLMIANIRGFVVKQNFFGRIFNFGDLTILNANAQFKLRSLTKPFIFKNKAYKQVSSR